MAIGMKGWLGIVAAAFGLVALGTLPPSGLALPRETRLPEQVRVEALWTEVRSAARDLQALRWSDSLSALAAGTAEEGLAVGWHPSDGLTPEGTEAWRSTYAAALDALEPRDPDMVVGVFWQPFDHGLPRDVPDVGSRPVRDFVGTRDGTPYCLRVIPYSGPRARDSDLLKSDITSVATGSSLGPCRLYAAYGMPGARVGDWLESGAMGFGAWARPSEDFLKLGADYEIDVSLFGARQHPLFGSGLEVQGCLAGRAPACVRAVTDPEVIAPGDPDDARLLVSSSVSYIEETSSRLQAPFAYLDNHLLADAEREFGTEAFARFWKSEDAVPAAFEDAFGVELGDWVAGWTEREIGRYRAGPGVRGRDLLLGVLTVMVLAAAATRAGVRRRVD